MTVILKRKQGAIISCLCVHGLVSFMALQRNKEISISKVLDASATCIVVLLGNEFIVLILLAWYAMYSWLKDLVFSLPISPSSFLITLILSLLVAGMSIPSYEGRLK